MITDAQQPEAPLRGRAVKTRKLRVDEAHALDLSELRRAGVFQAPAGRVWKSQWAGWYNLSQAFYSVVADHTGPRALAVAHPLPEDDPERSIGYPVWLTSTRPHFGGRRYWFRCPGVVAGPCERRCRILYRPHWARHFSCRECHRLTYRSRQQHRNRWYEGFTKAQELMEEELRRPLSKLSDRERQRRLQRYERVNPTLDKLNEALESRRP